LIGVIPWGDPSNAIQEPAQSGIASQ